MLDHLFSKIEYFFHILSTRLAKEKKLECVLKGLSKRHFGTAQSISECIFFPYLEIHKIFLKIFNACKKLSFFSSLTSSLFLFFFNSLIFQLFLGKSFKLSVSLFFIYTGNLSTIASKGLCIFDNKFIIHFSSNIISILNS